MLTEGTPPPRPDYQRIVDADRASFDGSRPTVSPGTFPVQADALRYMLIPPRLLELAPDPDAIDVVPIIHSPTRIEALVIAKPYTPIEAKRRKKTLRPLTRSSAMAHHKAHLTREGRLDSNDEALLYLDITGGRDGQITVHYLEDRRELHNLGIVTSLYERLRETGRELGFRFITGINDTDRSLKFFKNRGRFSLDQIRPDMQDTFDHLPEELDSYPDFTIDFLNPEDIPVFVRPEILASMEPNQT